MGVFRWWTLFASLCHLPSTFHIATSASVHVPHRNVTLCTFSHTAVLPSMGSPFLLPSYLTGSMLLASEATESGSPQPYGALRKMRSRCTQGKRTVKTKALVGRCCGLREETRNQRLISPRQPLAPTSPLPGPCSLPRSVLGKEPGPLCPHPPLSTPTVSTLYFVLKEALLLPDLFTDPREAQGTRWHLATQAGVQI